MHTKKSSGFLLIEIMMALGVLTLLVLCAARYQGHIAEHRADTALCLKMTQRARIVFEELRAITHKPQESAGAVDGMTVQVSVRPLRAPLGHLSVFFSTEKLHQFVIVTVTISGKTSMGVMRSLAFTSGMRAPQE